jgi:enoyl-CoA hydratase/carnithine racemase
MGYSDYKCFRLGFDSGVAIVSIDHPPINLLDDVLSQEFDGLGKELEADESVRVVVLQSASPAFLSPTPVWVGLEALPKRSPIPALFV